MKKEMPGLKKGIGTYRPKGGGDGKTISWTKGGNQNQVEKGKNSQKS